jgi:O-antigen/teichoic acid export membrane protein
VYYNFSIWFKLTDKTYYATIITVTGAVITIVANYILIPIAGYMGSSWATLICYFSTTAMCYILGQRYYPIPYDIPKSVAYIALTTLLVYGVLSITIENQWFATGFHILIILAYLFIVHWVEKKGLRTLTK